MSTPPVVLDPNALEPEGQRLSIVTADNESAALLFLSKVKTSIDALESEKEAKCRPYLDDLDRIRRPFLDAIAAFKSLKLKVETGLNNYRVKIQREREAEQRRLLEDNQRIKREADEKAERDRKAAEDAQREKERLEEEAAKELTPAQRTEVEEDLREVSRKADRLESKAEKSEAAAVSVPPPVVVEQVQKTVESADGAKHTFKEEKDWLFSNGFLKDMPFYRDDPRFKDVPDQFFKFDQVAMNKFVKAGGRPAGVVIVPNVGTMTRKAKP